MVTIEEYRGILKDFVSPDELVRSRLQFLESFCRNVIRNEIEKYKSNLYEQSKKNFRRKEPKSL